MRVLRNEREKGRKFKIWSNRSSVVGSGGDEGAARTFGDFDAFDGLVVHCAGALFNELVAFDTEIEDICVLHAELDEPFRRNIDNVGRSLPSCRAKIRKKKGLWTINDETFQPCIL